MSPKTVWDFSCPALQELPADDIYDSDDPDADGTGAMADSHVSPPDPSRGNQLPSVTPEPAAPSAALSVAPKPSPVAVGPSPSGSAGLGLSYYTPLLRMPIHGMPM